ncbi:Asp23/Gls24 family envelope stress response protein [Chengkuizengella axinellae]|uniref:Asp23/Gls24 family envelope stress response protein n=1 Tax=Chengkuizengella axinellae TaxID=3064388 RepID=A0ABT9J1I3_9BACL|nr:Asp23/Gls24 family envelope stress response protein [Chengkuizengella sp. 2205SS18-9]MDP5275467.1 Asp23/Gls24 family envelope stress response protein [Chengkuizengella sp. 2205SS18-9]
MSSTKTLTNLELERRELGRVHIVPEVIEIIAGMATIEVDGVASMSGGIAGGIAEWIGRKNLSKGIKVEVGEKEVIVDVSIIVEYGKEIPVIASNIQGNVKEAIESMTGLVVVEVNLNVHGIDFDQEDNKEIVEEKTTRIK